jgi:5-methylcytosine-specific restriction endonuclease McrA
MVLQNVNIGAPCPGLMTADHLVPRYAGGKTVPGNIVAACGQCNNSRNSETNQPKAGTIFSIGDDAPSSPFEPLLARYRQ